MRCIFCHEGKTKRGKTTFASERDGKVVVIRDIPADVCDMCGEAYLSSEIAQQVFDQADAVIKDGTEMGIFKFAA